MNSRRTKIIAFQNNVDISDYIIGMTYTDNTGSTDDLTLNISDREKFWSQGLFPETGDTLNVKIQLLNWNYEGEEQTLDLGSFEIDNYSNSGQFTINAVSVPIKSSIRSEKKSRSWEKVRLSTIASDISNSANLKLIYDTSVDPYYDKTDQTDTSDLSFLEELSNSDGLCVKITNNQLIIFEESKYDEMEATYTIKLGSSDLYGNPSFSRSAKNIYAACEINYYDSKTDKTYTGRFECPNAPNVGHILRLNESYNSISDDVNLDRKAKARLREQNKNEWTVSCKLKGDITLFAGNNIMLSGWYKFDGKYHIESCSHSISSSGYSTSIEARKCLEGY